MSLDKKILAIETSCDETAASVVKNGREVLSNEIYSQIDIHAEYGGVVPEIASRNHTHKLPFIVNKALEKSGYKIEEIDAVAVTYGPGLVGALLTGVSFAKAYAYANKKPLIPVNHIEGHICSNFISNLDLKPPFICLIVSGGHTHIVNVAEQNAYTLLGQTRDDAAGEAFDKVARVLGLKYPGGPNLEKLAVEGDGEKYIFPKGFKGEKHLDFTFSGLKTSVINKLHMMDQKYEEYNVADIAASFQKTVVDVLTKNTFEAIKREGAKKVCLAGGVSANGALRESFKNKAKEQGIELYLPKKEYCTDNAAMIASAAYFRMNNKGIELSLNANPSLKLEFK
jgi:N6-L-threonylcarbamoyladenine synthase